MGVTFCPESSEISDIVKNNNLKNNLKHNIYNIVSVLTLGLPQTIQYTLQYLEFDETDEKFSQTIYHDAKSIAGAIAITAQIATLSYIAYSIADKVIN